MTIALDEATQIVQNLYHAFNGRDADGALANVAPGVDWQRDIEGGRIVGRDALRAYWQGLWSSGDPRAEPMRIDVAGDGKVVVRVDELVRDASGKVVINRQVEHILTFEGLFVSRMDIVELPEESDDEEEEEA